MKHIIISTFLSVLLVSPAFADWIEDFDVNLDTQGIEVAVAKALEEGKTPTEIVDRATQIEGLNPQNVLKALYCEGAAGDDIKIAADTAGISELILLAAFDKSVAECGDAVADSQAYTPVAQGPRFAGLPSPAGRTNIRTASVSTF
jgi:hypothetical protein